VRLEGNPFIRLSERDRDRHMDRIAEIVQLEGMASANREDRSASRWKAAKLIWEELQEKSFTQLSQEIKLAGGSGSIGHLTYASRSWEITVVKSGLKFNSLKSLPNFNTIYNSDDIRRPEDRKRRDVGDGSDRKREPGKDPRSEYTAHGLVVQADNAIDALLRSPAYHQLISDEDIVILRKLPAEIRSLIRKCGR